MDYEVLINRAVFLSLGYLLTISILVGCNQSEIPANQKANGDCTQQYLNFYNKIAGADFATEENPGESKKNACVQFLKKYGAIESACKATDLATGQVAELKSSSIREICKPVIGSKVYSEVND